MAKISDLIDINDGNAWQTLATELLILKYGEANFQKIPDLHQGDWGLEGYTFGGYAFQCYAPVRSHSIADQAVLQKNKITIDIKKFIDNESELKKLIHPQKYTRWFFLTTVFESKTLPAHCAEKTAEVLASCGHVDNDFKIVVYDADDFFMKEIPIYISTGKNKISLPAKQYQEDQISAHLKNNSTHHSTLVAKLTAAKVPESKHNELIYHFINNYLNWKDMMKSFPPDLGEMIQKKINSLELDIVLKYKLNPNLTPNELNAEIEILKSKILSEVDSVIDSNTVDYLSRGVVAEWLIRCPINF